MRRQHSLIGFLGACGLTLLLTFPNLGCSATASAAGSTGSPTTATASATPGGSNQSAPATHTATAAASTPANHGEQPLGSGDETPSATSGGIKAGTCIKSASHYNDPVQCRPGVYKIVDVLPSTVSPDTDPIAACKVDSPVVFASDSSGDAIRIYSGQILCLVWIRKT